MMADESPLTLDQFRNHLSTSDTAVLPLVWTRPQGPILTFIVAYRPGGALLVVPKESISDQELDFGFRMVSRVNRINLANNKSVK